MNLVTIEATTIEDAWFQCIYKILEAGSVFKIDSGSYAGSKRLEFDYITIRLKAPNIKPLIPQIPSHYNIPNPVADDYLDDYLPYLMTGEEKSGESYTYGQRICKENVTNIMSGVKRSLFIKGFQELDSGDSNDWLTCDNNYFDFLNQMELMIWTYKNKGHRNNQMVLQVADPADMLLQDPPCLRQIDTRIQDGKLHFFPYFRSWDLWGGFPANLAAIQMMKEYCAGEIGVEDGEIIAASKGLHIYDYAFDLGKLLAMKENIELNEK
jgi:thymidylate synthase